MLVSADIKRAGPPLLHNDRAALWDLGDGVCCFELTSKMNTIDAAVFNLLGRAIDHVEAKARALVIYSDRPQFLGRRRSQLDCSSLAKSADWPAVVALASLGPARFQAAQISPRCRALPPWPDWRLAAERELPLHCSAIVAHAETAIGLVETAVGILPAWGGCGELLLRWQNAPRLPKGPMRRRS